MPAILIAGNSSRSFPSYVLEFISITIAYIRRLCMGDRVVRQPYEVGGLDAKPWIFFCSGLTSGGICRFVWYRYGKNRLRVSCITMRIVEDSISLI